MPDIDASVWQVYRDQGVLVFGIHPGDDPDQLADFIEQTGIDFPIVRDQGSRGELAFPPGVGYPYPRDVVVDKNLTIRSIRNSFNVTEIDALIQQLIAE